MNTTLTTTTSSQDLNKSPESPFTETDIYVFNLVVRILISGPLALFGVVSNAMNVIIFYRQGVLSSSSNVILTGLSVSDLFVSIMATFSFMFAIIDNHVDSSTWSWNPGHFSVIVTARPYNCFVQVTCWITTFLTFERAISVTFPFKVKSLFSPKRSFIIVTLIFVVTLVLYVPRFLQYTPSWYTNTNTNISSVIYVRDHTFPKQIFTTFFYLCPVFFQFASVSIVVLCNTIIFWKVKLSYKFRKTKANAAVASSSQADVVSASHKSEPEKGPGSDTKEAKLLRMVTVISVIFAVCYSFTVYRTILLNIIFEYGVDYHWTVEHIVYDTCKVFQLFNSTINTVIFYKMSSRFKEELNSFWKKGMKK